MILRLLPLALLQCLLLTAGQVLLKYGLTKVGAFSWTAHYFVRLFGVTNMPFDAGDWKIVLSQCWMYLVPAVVFATPLPQMLFKKVSKKTVGWVILAAVFVASIFFMSTAASEPFLYFSF